MAAASRLREKQMDLEYRTALAQQDRAIDLQMNERAKLWEIQKMELRSQIDFQREEQLRQRKLDSYDNIDSQLDKEVQSGRMREKDAEPYRLKNNLARQGMNISISEITRQQEGDDSYGVRPYYLEPEFERDYPELAEAKKKEVIEGRTGTVPYHLSPEFLRTLPPSTAQDMLADKGIFFNNDEEFEAWLVNLERDTPTERQPLGDKELDIGVRAQPRTERPGMKETTGLPRVLSDADYDALPSGTEFIDQRGRRWRKP